ncbi:unnamed protein product [Acanthosepion pharaonis]|uniref:Uncharacterized protein n=1 Tax=Acanthosepion pharaonis TaxID=158019 RepID=A0A812BXD4_ACAPH|nr:unnamed protein product [Sepia pharaonis]
MYQSIYLLGKQISNYESSSRPSQPIENWKNGSPPPSPPPNPSTPTSNVNNDVKNSTPNHQELGDHHHQSHTSHQHHHDSEEACDTDHGAGPVEDSSRPFRSSMTLSSLTLVTTSPSVSSTVSSVDVPVSLQSSSTSSASQLTHPSNSTNDPPSSLPPSSSPLPPLPAPPPSSHSLRLQPIGLSPSWMSSACAHQMEVPSWENNYSWSRGFPVGPRWSPVWANAPSSLSCSSRPGKQASNRSQTGQQAGVIKDKPIHLTKLIKGEIITDPLRFSISSLELIYILPFYWNFHWSVYQMRKAIC